MLKGGGFVLEEGFGESVVLEGGRELFLGVEIWGNLG